MKLLYIFRKPNSGFSIEGLFSRLAERIAYLQRYEAASVYAPHMTLRLWGLWQNLRFARRLRADIYHITGDVHYLMLLLPPKQTVLTIHDCVSLERQLAAGNQIRFRLLWLLFYYMPMRRAIYITTVSEKSKQELKRFMGVKLASKVRVVPNYANPNFRPKPSQLNRNNPRLLQVGTSHNKNLHRLIDALQGLRCTLVIVGRIGDELHQYISQAGIRYELHEGLSDAQMLAQYERCDLVTFISVYEGFGLPIIEANAVGRPVITSDIPPMNGVANGAACMVDPYSVEAIRAGLQRLLSDEAYRSQLIEAGYRNAAQYSIDTVAAQYDTIYQEILR
ncbi:glycosyltransferase family 4 protein [Fibrella forsythiae]|uniref:Glycosyltransferase family 4 protein n=1 Tax=Fibrella forsythiae TaxID=2817061 RepID=A0ABS3JSY8_9BACT|nr:glycosyltransferase family 1 protein [Fibrella forsythiae]MBO0952319.1 glycosyltransferase family 4 protein [Fibrella forsythiae]